MKKNYLTLLTLLVLVHLMPIFQGCPGCPPVNVFLINAGGLRAGPHSFSEDGFYEDGPTFSRSTLRILLTLEAPDSLNLLGSRNKKYSTISSAYAREDCDGSSVQFIDGISQLEVFELSKDTLIDRSDNFLLIFQNGDLLLDIHDYLSDFKPDYLNLVPDYLIEGDSISYAFRVTLTDNRTLSDTVSIAFK